MQLPHVYFASELFSWFANNAVWTQSIWRCFYRATLLHNRECWHSIVDSLFASFGFGACHQNTVCGVSYTTFSGKARCGKLKKLVLQTAAQLQKDCSVIAPNSCVQVAVKWRCRLLKVVFFFKIQAQCQEQLNERCIDCDWSRSSVMSPQLSPFPK